MGYATAMAYALFAMIFVFTLLQFRLRRDIEY
jgi:ABC-type sugar transport system permease subunit